MNSGVFTQFRKINEPRSKPPTRRKQPQVIKGLSSHTYDQHGILNCGKKNLVGWKIYGRK